MKLRMLLISLLLASNVLGKGRVTEYNHRGGLSSGIIYAHSFQVCRLCLTSSESHTLIKEALNKSPLF